MSWIIAVSPGCTVSNEKANEFTVRKVRAVRVWVLRFFMIISSGSVLSLLIRLVNYSNIIDKHLLLFDSLAKIEE
jgi:hypothetical protein